MRQALGTAVTAILVVCALAVTTIAVRREVRSSRAAASPFKAGTREVSDWRSFEKIGHRVGPANARATITEFVDYECPACKQFRGDLADVVAAEDKTHPGGVAIVFVHFPLPMHRFAKISGQAVECADAQGRFTQMQGALFAKQDSFGLKPWAEYARDAGIKDSLGFANCLRDSSSAQKVILGLQLAEKLNLPATPTIFLNGWQYVGAPPRDQLQAAIERVLRGDAPKLGQAVDASGAMPVVGSR